jgi:hypothetical protein
MYRYRLVRLPGYEDLSQEEYAKLMREKLAERTKAVLEAREDKPVLGAERLSEIKPGSRPKKTKTSGPRDHRARVLSKDSERRSAGETWYFSIYFEYREASKNYRSGDLDAKFPNGTYKPPLFTVARPGMII